MSSLSKLDEGILRCKYFIRRMAGSKIQWYGLDTSAVSVESVPLVVASGGQSGHRIVRKTDRPLH